MSHSSRVDPNRRISATSHHVFDPSEKTSLIHPSRRSKPSVHVPPRRDEIACERPKNPRREREEGGKMNRRRGPGGRTDSRSSEIHPNTWKPSVRRARKPYPQRTVLKVNRLDTAATIPACCSYGRPLFRHHGKLCMLDPRRAGLLLRSVVGGSHRRRRCP